MSDSYPSPALAPVMISTLPAREGMSVSGLKGVLKRLNILTNDVGSRDGNKRY